MPSPPENLIQHAVIAARMSPCAKSKRGAVIFEPGSTEMLAHGHNRPPGTLRCDGSAACRASCAKACLHAEQDAIRCLPTRFARFLTGKGVHDRTFNGEHQLELVHVKIVSGELVAGGKPSCWQCSRLAYECGIAVWLYESNVQWHSRECLNGHVHIFGDEKAKERFATAPELLADRASYGQIGDDRDDCPKCGRELSPVELVHHSIDGTWHRYGPRDFHEATAITCGVHLPWFNQ